MVKIEIRDNGVGINEDCLKDIFDPFYSTKETGTGIGLPLSLAIIENHGGTISVHPREGQGTRVRIEIPVNKEGDNKRNDFDEKKDNRS